ncbi:L,D-transpeptidase [Yinghuangia soli]|uniref:L,D-transpeptidase n=1 Tax=Yinghuangia soli TaxID=2908204 RepID=A0AA41U3A2_9ACTN|nr:L,D-transpeptidase [Yinghuangia soli]MCF2531571.1 L,D-transpeptidase [Yinghuangia soli]
MAVQRIARRSDRSSDVGDDDGAGGYDASSASGPDSAPGPGARGLRRPVRRLLLSASLAGALLMALAPASEAAAPKKASNPCPRGYVRIVCVDLNNQQLWMQDKNGKRTFGPVPIRSGRKGYPTRTGLKKIYVKRVKDWSYLYNVSMPYSQYFDGGQAFHAYAGNIYSQPGSHGCVNMRYSDAKRLYSLTKTGDRAYIWGKRR